MEIVSYFKFWEWMKINIFLKWWYDQSDGEKKCVRKLLFFQQGKTKFGIVKKKHLQMTTNTQKSLEKNLLVCQFHLENQNFRYGSTFGWVSYDTNPMMRGDRVKIKKMTLYGMKKMKRFHLQVLKNPRLVIKNDVGCGGVYNGKKTAVGVEIKIWSD